MGIAIGSINETELLNSFEDGIKRKEFFFHYQVKYDLKTDKAIGAEVLIRWMHPYYWFLTPNKFIPLLEREGLIKELDIYVARMVCDKLKEIRKSKPDFRLSFNISRQGFSDKKTIEEIVRIIEESNLPKENIEIDYSNDNYTYLSASYYDKDRLSSMGYENKEEGIYISYLYQLYCIYYHIFSFCFLEINLSSLYR